MHGWRRDSVGGVVVAGARIVDALITEQEEGLVLAVVDVRDVHRTAERPAPGIEQEIRPRSAGLVQEEVVSPETGTLEGVVRGAMEIVGTGFDTDVSHTALRLPELRIEGRRLHLELLHDIGGRHIRRCNLVGVGARRGGRTVDRDIVQQAAGSAHGEVHDVGRLERTIQPDAAVKGDAGGEANQQEWVAIRERKVRDAFGIDYGAQRGAFRVEQGYFRTHRHLLFRSANFQRDVDIEAIGDADLHVMAKGRLKPRCRDFNLIRARRQAAVRGKSRPDS